MVISLIVKFQSFDSELDEIYKDFFATGKRYNILENILDPSHEYNLLVEIGSGGGATLKYLNEKFKFKNIVGYDLFFQDTVLKSNKYKNIKLLEGSFNNDLPIQDNSVDCLVLMMVIEHLFDPFHSFSQVHRLLSTDGLAFINLPLITSIKNRFRLLIGNVPETSIEYNRWFQDKEWDGNHLHYFSINSIKKIWRL